MTHNIVAFWYSNYHIKYKYILFDIDWKGARKIRKFYKKNEKSRIKIARNGKKKYFKLFNELKTTKYIIDKSLGNRTILY